MLFSPLVEHFHDDDDTASPVQLEEEIDLNKNALDDIDQQLTFYDIAKSNKKNSSKEITFYMKSKWGSDAV
jgi:hypothetical protein